MQMPQSLSVGLTALPPGWKRIMRQEGFELKTCSFDKSVSPKAFAAIIANSPLNEKQARNAIRFLHSGGAILTTYQFATAIDPAISFEEKRVKFIEPHGDFFAGSGLLWLNQNAAFFPGHNKPLPLEKRMGKGFLIVLPFDPGKATLSEAYEKRAFVVVRKAVAEFAPATSKSHIRKVVSNCLQHLFELRQLPFVHLWYYPKKFSSVLGFHIDVDFFSADTIETIQLFKELRFEPTWFLNMQAAADANKEIIRQLKKQKFVGQHAFVHDFFKDEKQSHANAIKGDLLMKKLGFKPRSFSAPNGVWGHGIAKAVQRLGYDFAIAFSLDSENLPFNPIVDGKEAGFLFLPTHPVCIGLMKMYDCSEKEMKEYFATVIERNAALGIPLFFYGHPFKEIARFPNVISEIFSAARARKGIWIASHGQLAQWWRQRQGIEFKAFADEGKLKISCQNSKDAFFRIVFNGKQTFAKAKNSEIEFGKLRKGKKLPNVFLHDTAAKPSPLGKKHLIKRFASGLIKKLFGEKINQWPIMLPKVLRKIAATILPYSVKRAIKRLARLPKRAQVYKKKAAGSIVSKQGIINGLRKLGIKEGDTIFVHSSLSAFGYMEGGAEAVIDALLSVVGGNGNVCMPSFGPLPDGKTFDVRKTPSAQGKISDLFWRLPNARRSLRPTHCVACIGKDAQKITGGHHLDKTPFGKNSPYYKIMELDGKVIMLGSPVKRSFTCCYIFEDMKGEQFPIKVYEEKEKEFIVIDESGQKGKMLSKVHAALDDIRLDFNDKVAERLDQGLLQLGFMRKGMIGEAQVRVVRLQDYLKALDKWLAEGKTAYADETEIIKKDS